MSGQCQGHLGPRHQARLEDHVVERHARRNCRNKGIERHLGTLIQTDAAAHERCLQSALRKPARGVREEQKAVTRCRTALPNRAQHPFERCARGRVLRAVALDRAELRTPGRGLHAPERRPGRSVGIHPQLHARTPARSKGREARRKLPPKVVVQRHVDHQRAARRGRLRELLRTARGQHPEEGREGHRGGKAQGGCRSAQAAPEAGRAVCRRVVHSVV